MTIAAIAGLAMAAGGGAQAGTVPRGRGLPYVHNGSHVTVDAVAGTISYYLPKPSIAKVASAGDIVFRGHIGPDRVVGTAYVFRRGCPPAGYAVSGPGFRGEGDAITLAGAAPVRAPGSCAVTGMSTAGANARLVFEPAGGADE